MGTLVIEIDENDAKARHIAQLQSVITKRNEEIERLQARLDAGEGSPLVAAAFERGRREGWTACSHALMNAVDTAILALTATRKDGFDALLRGEELARQARQTPSDAGSES
jgi:hypothetical protein